MRLHGLYISLLIVLSNQAETVKLNSNSITIKVGQISYCEGDVTDSSEIVNFIKLSTNSIRLPNNYNGYTFSFTLSNEQDENSLLIGSILPYLDEVRAYRKNEDGKLEILQKTEDSYPLFSFDLDKSTSTEILVFVKSAKQYNIPLLVTTKSFQAKTNQRRDILIGCFLGIMLAMLFYNLVIWFTTRQVEYISYILYVLFITLAQIRFLGFDYFFVPDSLVLKDSLLFLGSSFSGMAATVFAIRFLDIRKNLPKYLFAFQSVIVLYLFTAILFLTGYSSLAYRFIQLGGLLGAFLFVPSCIYLIRINYKPAKVYLFAWSFLMVGLVAYSLRDFGLIEANIWVNISFPFGVAIETVLLSLALANRINILKKEKEESDKRVISEIKKNEELVINQNIVLEKKVKERTTELEQALSSLKSAQSRLVQSEKMASLGVLTAGIAHEINNPINFVSANVIPLKENIDILTTLLSEYKQINLEDPKGELLRIEKMEHEYELDYLLKETDLLIEGIEEGAKRTHTIVDGLKTFSRGDGRELSLTNINGGIESTLSVLKNKLSGIKVTLHLDHKLPLLYCQIGKLNQVFLNLINNAIDALEERYGREFKDAEITITTYLGDKNEVCTQIKDNANGIASNDLEKLFEPFYTTKSIGKGTGLGLAISYGIVEEHNGSIEVETEIGKGSIFTVCIPQSKT